MIYASAAAVVIALLAWDFGRRALLTRIIGIQQRGRIDALEKRLGHVEAIACEIEGNPAVDLSKHDAAVINLGKQLKELSEHVDREIKRVQSSQAAVVASGRRLVG